jgi:hypothetical protein
VWLTRASSRHLLQANLMAMLEKRAERKEVDAVIFGGPVDRGPAEGGKFGAEGAKFMRGWQYQVTGKPAAATVLHDLNVKRIRSGGRRCRLPLPGAAQQPRIWQARYV